MTPPNPAPATDYAGLVTRAKAQEQDLFNGQTVFLLRELTEALALAQRERDDRYGDSLKNANTAIVRERERDEARSALAAMTTEKDQWKARADIVAKQKQEAERERDYWKEKTETGRVVLLEQACSRLESALALAQTERDAIQETLTQVEHDVAIVYCHITDGLISKVNTDPQVVKSVADDCTTELVNEETKQAEARVAALETLANRYARHDSDCDVTPNHPKRCRCGYLADLRAALGEGRP